MPTSDYTPSDAAKAYAIEQGHESCAQTPSRWATCDCMPTFDAGCAHALAMVTPRTISTAAELDALPEKAAVLDSAGDAWQEKFGEWGWARGNLLLTAARLVEEYAPLTLLVPATAAPEPVRLTDPDDPRIKPGAVIEFRADRTIVDDGDPAANGQWSLSALHNAMAGGLIGSIGFGEREFILLAEAPDPDAELVAKVDDALSELDGGYVGDRGAALVAALRQRNVIKRADS